MMYDGADISGIIAYCATNGVVFADSESLLCAYPANKSLLCKKETKKAIDIYDTWYVCIGIGKKSVLMSLVEPKEYVAFRRLDDNIRVIPWRKLWATQ